MQALKQCTLDFDPSGRESKARMMRKLFAPATTPKWVSINDVESAVTLKLSQKSKITLRESIEVAVVDDQPFEPFTNLRNNHYRVEYFSDINNISLLEKYPVVLCDLQGVGAQLNPDLQGAHLIREIKAQSPEKVVIAYSGIAKNRTMSQTANSFSDQFIKKDADLDEWIGALDQAINLVSNPVRQWKLFRVRMLNAGMTPIQLTELEDSFARSLMDGQGQTAAAVAGRATAINLQQDLRAILQSFVAAMIFQAVTAG